MGVHYEWSDSTHQIMHIYIVPPWTWNELQEVGDAGMREIKAVEHLTATEVSKVHVLPSGNVLTNLLYMEKQIPPNVVASVLVGAPYIIKMFMSVLMKLGQKASRIMLFADSMDAAHKMVAERIKTLNVK